MIWPLKYISINQKFGEKAQVYTDLGLLGHDGIDLYAPDSTPVYAAHDGRVMFAGYDSSGGLGIRIRTEDTHEYQGKEVYWATIFWHLKTGSLKVTGSQLVKQGDLIALSDNTGLSTGSHLHFALEPMLRSPNKVDFAPVDTGNGYRGYIDPMPYLPQTKNFQVELELGQEGDAVEKLQAFLIRNGFMPPVNVPLGYYGDKTSAAVLAFQKKYCKLSWYEEHVMQGTKVGPKTLEALNNYQEI